MNTEQERADFEAFASKHGLCVTEDGDLYRSHVVAWMWKAWQARAALQSQDREDAERLDWLDSMNAKLNSNYGTTYRWKLVLSPNVVRLMSGAGGNGHVAAIDLHDSEAHGALSCREAIDHARRAREGEQ